MNIINISNSDSLSEDIKDGIFLLAALSCISE